MNLTVLTKDEAAEMAMEAARLVLAEARKEFDFVRKPDWVSVSEKARIEECHPKTISKNRRKYDHKMGPSGHYLYRSERGV